MPSPLSRSRTPIAALASAVAIFCLTFASAAGAFPARPTTVTGTVTTNGKPVSGVAVAVYGAGESRARWLGGSKTASDGSFSIDYEVPLGGLVYAITNDASGRRREVAVIGSPLDVGCASTCGRRATMAGRLIDPAAGLESSLTINERTTVASSFALAQYFHGTTIYGVQPGLSNAGATASNLADPRTGKLSSVLANSPNGNASATLPTFNTLANVVLSCTRGTSVDCVRLMKAAKVPGEDSPTNTASAIAGIARNPTTNPKGLFRLAATKKAYTTALSKAPASWLIGLVYTAGGFDAPGYIAFDASGNSWTGNNFAPSGTSGVGAGVTVLSPTGRPILGSPIVGGGIQGVGWGGAVAPNGNVWIANYGGNSMSLIGPDGTVISPSGGYTQGGSQGLSKPQGTAVGVDGTVWIANFGNNSVTRYANGDPDQALSVTSGITKPFSVVVDDDNKTWVGNGAESPNGASIAKLNPDGTPVAGSPFTASGLRSPQGIAVDSAGNVWAANQFSNAVVQLKPNGKAASGSPYRHGVLFGSWGLAIDGKDRIWVGGFEGATITALCGADESACPPGKKTGDLLSPSKGFTSAAMQRFTSVAIDPSGNVWGAHNYSTSSPVADFVGGNGLFEIIGAAAPVNTPIRGAVKQPESAQLLRAQKR